MATIIFKRSTTPGNLPTLIDGEIAINMADRLLFVNDSTGTRRFLNFTSDAEKVASGAIATALNGKAALVHTHIKGDVGLGNVDNTSDAIKALAGNPIGDAIASKPGSTLSDLLGITLPLRESVLAKPYIPLFFDLTTATQDGNPTVDQWSRISTAWATAKSLNLPLMLMPTSSISGTLDVKISKCLAAPGDNSRLITDGRIRLHGYAADFTSENGGIGSTSEVAISNMVYFGPSDPSSTPYNNYFISNVGVENLNLVFHPVTSSTNRGCINGITFDRCINSSGRRIDVSGLNTGRGVFITSCIRPDFNGVIVHDCTARPPDQVYQLTALCLDDYSRGRSLLGTQGGFIRNVTAYNLTSTYSVKQIDAVNDQGSIGLTIDGIYGVGVDELLDTFAHGSTYVNIRGLNNNTSCKVGHSANNNYIRGSSTGDVKWGVVVFAGNGGDTIGNDIEWNMIDANGAYGVELVGDATTTSKRGSDGIYTTVSSYTTTCVRNRVKIFVRNSNISRISADHTTTGLDNEIIYDVDAATQTLSTTAMFQSATSTSSTRITRTGWDAKIYATNDTDAKAKGASGLTGYRRYSDGNDISLASGAELDRLTGFADLGFIVRTSAGTYSFTYSPTFTSITSNGTVFVNNTGDAILQIETTGSTTSTYRKKQIFSSPNVGGGSNWLFRSVRPSDGATVDHILSGTVSGEIWHTGNLTPSNYALITTTGATTPFSYNRVGSSGNTVIAAAFANPVASATGTKVVQDFQPNNTGIGVRSVQFGAIATDASNGVAGVIAVSNGAAPTDVVYFYPQQILPFNDAGLNLGSAARRFGNVYFGNAYISTGYINSLNIGSTAQGTLEIGRTDGQSSIPYIDLHSSGANTDYDARISASGGSTTVTGQGTLTLTAVGISLSSRPTFNGNLAWDAGNTPTLSKVINFREKKFILSDYGAIINDSAAATASANVTAWNNLITDLQSAPRGGTIIVPNDDFYFNGTLNATPSYACFVEGAGNYSRLIFNNVTDSYAIAINGQGSNPLIGVSNLRISGFNSSNITSMVILRGGRLKKALRCDNLYLEGDSTFRPSNAFLELINPYNCNFNGINIEAGSVGAYGSQSIGVVVRGDGQDTAGAIAVDFKFDALMISRCNTGVKLTPSATTNHTLEGAMFNDCVIAGVQTGLDYQSPGDLTPGMSWRGGHINASKYGMVLGNVAQFKISDVLFYMDVYNSPVAAVQIQAACKDISIHNNTIWMVDTQNTGTNASMNAIIVTGSSVDTDILMNKFYMKTTDPYLRIDAGCQRTRYGFNDKITGGGNALTNNGTASTDLGGNTVR